MSVSLLITDSVFEPAAAAAAAVAAGQRHTDYYSSVHDYRSTNAFTETHMGPMGVATPCNPCGVDAYNWTHETILNL